MLMSSVTVDMPHGHELALKQNLFCFLKSVFNVVKASEDFELLKR